MAGENAEEASEVACDEIEIDGAGEGESEAEAECFVGSEQAGGQRARGGAAHVAVGFAFDVVIERGGASGDEHGAEDDVNHVQPRHGTANTHVETGAGGHEDEERYVGLGEGDVGAKFGRLRERRGARASVRH